MRAEVRSTGVTSEWRAEVETGTHGVLNDGWKHSCQNYFSQLRLGQAAWPARLCDTENLKSQLCEQQRK